MANFLALCPEGPEGELNTRLVALYAVYQAFNILNHPSSGHLQPLKLLKECAWSAVLGDYKNSSWLMHYHSGFRAPAPELRKGKKRTKASSEKSTKTRRCESTWEEGSTEITTSNSTIFQFGGNLSVRMHQNSTH